MTETGGHTLTYSIGVPRNVAGAIACVQIRARDAGPMDDFVRTHGLAATSSTPHGTPTLRGLLDVDEGLVVRWDDRTLDLFPHAGPAIVRALARALEAAGVIPAQGSDGAGALPWVYPEAAGEIEQRMLAALADAASPLAVDLLLDQPRRWRAHNEGDPLADGESLGRLLRPPLVAAVGAPNIGKSTLLNALAGRSVAVVADVPGTTRDHVGAMLDLGGLVVRYLDTPGLLGAGGDQIDRDARSLADAAAGGADLVLRCGDPGREPPPFDTAARALPVCLRGDLLGADGPGPAWAEGLVVCAQTGVGMPGLIGAIRDTLVPPASLTDGRPWRFW